MYIIIILIGTIILLTLGLDIKIKDLKNIKEKAYDKSLVEITNKLPENEEVCKKILEILKNENVTIQKEDDSKTSLYMVMQNKIIIGNIKNSFTRIQTIAHECIHSIQNKNILKFNFIFSNIYLLYFAVAIICTMLKIPKSIEISYILLLIQIMLSLIYIIIRSYIEIDAMTRAPYLSKDYLNLTNLSKEEKQIINSNCEELNKIGIKLYVYTLCIKCIIRTLIYSLIISLF